MAIDRNSSTELGKVLKSTKKDSFLPSPKELVRRMKEVDLKTVFEGVELESVQANELKLRFDSIEQSHLFALALGARGNEQELFYFSPTETFYGEDLLDTRLDGDQFNYHEKNDETGIVGTVQIRYAQDYPVSKRQSYTALVKELIRDIMPDLNEVVEKLNF